MTQNRTVLALAVLFLSGAVALFWQTSTADTRIPTAAEIDLIAGETLYAENCAACHGANLEGQGDWRTPGPDGRLLAPPHDETGHTWHHDDSLLFRYTKLGGKGVMAQQGMDFNSGMPGFGDQLSDAEIWNVLEYIKAQWPERERTIQAERTAANQSSGEN